MVDDREPMSTDEILNEGRDPLVERHPRRKSPILLIVVIVAGIVAFNFLNQKVDWLLLVTEKNDFAHSKFILLGKNSLESFYPKTVSVSEKGQID